MHMIPYCRFRSIVCIACMNQISAANKRREGGNVNLLRFQVAAKTFSRNFATLTCRVQGVLNWPPLLCTHQKTAQILQKRGAIPAIPVTMHYRVQSGLQNKMGRTLLSRSPYIALCSLYVGPKRCNPAPRVKYDLQCSVSGSCMSGKIRHGAPSIAELPQFQAVA
jgi:hypothetical protein